MTSKEIFEAWYHPNFFVDPKTLAWEAWKQSRKALADEQAQEANSRIGFLYEELRKAIDEGSESMTHDDALKQIAYWQDKEQAQAVEPVAWLVLDEDRGPIMCAPAKQMCNDHINDAINDFDIAEASKWVVRKAFTHPAPPPAGEQIDWQDMYLKQKSEKEAMAAKYEKDIGPLARVVPTATHGFKASRSENGAVFLEPTSLLPPRTAQEFKFGMEVLNWNRAQQDPPIDVGRELWVADEVLKLITSNDKLAPAEQQGLFRKFAVQRTDGSDEPGGKHHNCEYFVLDVTHDSHAPAALRAYAESCALTHPVLSSDLVSRWGAQQVAVPMLADSILKAARECKDIYSLISIKEMVQFTRAIEAHHGIGEKS